MRILKHIKHHESTNLKWIGQNIFTLSYTFTVLKIISRSKRLPMIFIGLGNALSQKQLTDNHCHRLKP